MCFFRKEKGERKEGRGGVSEKAGEMKGEKYIPFKKKTKKNMKKRT